METKYNLLTRILKNLKTSVLPSGTAANAGKVATIGETGEWEAATPSGGSGGGVLVVHDVDGTLDKTYKEIADAVFCVREELNNDGLHVIKPISSFAFLEGYGGAVMFGSDDYICSAENEYPAMDK